MAIAFCRKNGNLEKVYISGGNNIQTPSLFFRSRGNHSGLFLILENRRGYRGGVWAIFSIRITFRTTSVPGTVYR
jgi:hypothetical protein